MPNTRDSQRECDDEPRPVDEESQLPLWLYMVLAFALVGSFKWLAELLGEMLKESNNIRDDKKDLIKLLILGLLGIILKLMGALFEPEKLLRGMIESFGNWRSTDFTEDTPTQE